jgi:hypothetical protein
VNVSIDYSRAWDVVMIALPEITGTKGTEKAVYTEERSNGGRNGEDCKETRATGGRQGRPRVIVTDRRKNTNPANSKGSYFFVDP